MSRADLSVIGCQSWNFPQDTKIREVLHSRFLETDYTIHNLSCTLGYRDLVRRISGDNCEFVLLTMGKGNSCLLLHLGSEKDFKKTMEQVSRLSFPAWGPQ